MLSIVQARKVVDDCIRAVSHTPVVDTAASLDTAEISDQTRVNNLIHLIVSDEALGVRSKAHSIDDSAFQNISTDTIVDDLIKIVSDKSVPLISSPALGGDSTIGSDR